MQDQYLPADVVKSTFRRLRSKADNKVSVCVTFLSPVPAHEGENFWERVMMLFAEKPRREESHLHPLRAATSAQIGLLQPSPSFPHCIVEKCCPAR